MDSLDAVDIVRLFYIIGTFMVLIIGTFTEYLTYPVRPIGRPGSSKSVGALRRLAERTVPHQYFLHFYIVSTGSSVFWIIQLLTGGPAIHWMAARVNDREPSKLMSYDRMLLCCIVMAVHGARRWWESSIYRKSFTSQMLLPYWLAALAYYVSVNIAIWVEGAGIFRNDTSLNDLHVSPVLSLKTMSGLLMFFTASGLQHSYHRHLASLKKYTVPSHPFFAWVICPHYTAECGIYLSLSLLAAPKSEVLNKTMITVLVIVASNLAITSIGTRRWYSEKFGAETVRGKWNMVPGLF